MNKIEKYINLILKAKWWKENLDWKPTDIIWFEEFGRNLALKLEPYVTKKEICFFDENIKDDVSYHFLEFKDMFEKSELMIFTKEISKSHLDDLSKLNPNITIVIDWNFKNLIEIFSTHWFSKNIVLV